MNATEMVTLLQSETGDDSFATLMYDHISAIIEELDSMGYWRCLERKPPYQLNTTAPVTTGTVTLSNGSPTVTGASTAFTAAMVGQVFQASGEKPYYYISAVDVGAQTLTLEGNYLGTGGAGLSHSVYFVNYDLDSTVAPNKIKSILIQNTHRKLERLDDAERDLKWPDLLTTVKEPFWYSTWGQTSIQVLPVPDAAYVMLVRAQKVPRAVTSSQTVIDFPARMHRCIFFGALALAWEHKDDDNAPAARKTFESMALAHFSAENKDPDYAPRLERFNSRSRVSKMQSRMGSTINGSGPYS